ncbi:MAG: hypothetical protein LBU18_01290 [Treponema sp.]|jgi:uncharacterized membrane protein|nr:hypothetical protein [Treponema sp.]
MRKQEESLVPPQNSNVELQALLARQEFFSGPLPPPEVLKVYGEIDAGYPERLMKMAEAHAAADVHKKYKEPFNVTLGQILSFTLGLTGFGLSALFALKGLETGAIAAAIGGVAPIIIAATGNLRK